jgi:hypothetical protein
MAITEDFEVAILIDDEAATEYNDEDSQEQAGANTIMKYIEVKSGARFAFRFKVLPSYKPGEEDGFSFTICIDGRSTCGIVCKKECFNPFTGWTLIADSHYVGSGSDLKELMFSFADLETRMFGEPGISSRLTQIGDTCAADLATLKDKYNELGSLVVNVDPIRIYVDMSNAHHSSGVRAMRKYPKKH